jgi:hypothetical protein
VKTQCPTCNKIQESPYEYRGRKIKCLDCDTLFTAEFYKEPPSQSLLPVVIERLESRQITSSAASYTLGVILQIAGGLGILFALIGNFSTDQSLAYAGLWDKYSDYQLFLLDFLNDFATAIEVLLCVIIIGIGSLIKKPSVKNS